MTTSYELRRPWTVPETLEELTGPTHGTVHLPKHLNWSDPGVYDLENPKQLGVMYETVIRESADATDLRRFLDGATLVRIWRRMWLPGPARALWEARFPDLRQAA